MQYRKPVWQLVLFVVAALALAALACSVPGGAEPTPVPAATVAVEPTPVIEPTAEVAPTRTARPTAEPIAAELDRFEADGGMFAIDYPADWENEGGPESVARFTGEAGQILYIVYAPTVGEDSQTFDEVVESFKSGIEDEQDFELIDEESQSGEFWMEFLVYDTDAEELVHALARLQEVGNYSFVSAFAVPVDQWDDWRATGETILESLAVDEELASQPIETGNEPSTGDLTIVNQVQYQDEYDTWHISGEVRNDTDQTLQYVQLSVELFDAAGKSLQIDTLYVARDYLPPGELSPFMYYVDSDLEDFDSFELKIADRDEAGEELLALDVSNESLVTGEDGTVYVVGEVTNNGDVAVDVDAISASVFAGDEFRGGDSAWSYIHYLEPGDSGPFLIQVSGTIDDADAFNVFVDATEATYTEPADVAIENEVFYSDEYGYYHLVGELINNGGQRLSISVIASVYAPDGRLIDVATGSGFLGAIEQGESDIFDVSYYRLIEYAGLEEGDALTYRVQVDSYLTYETSTELVAGLVEGNEDQSSSGDTFTFTGEVENTNSFAVESAIVVVYVKDKASGQLLGAAYDWLSDEIPAGGTAEYEVSVYLLPGTNIDDVEYAIVARAQAK
jgi:hypothetical protein